MYQIEDKQIPGRLFADGATFKTKTEVRDQLRDYHRVDVVGAMRMSLKTLLDVGGWEIIQTKEKQAKVIR